MHVCASRGSWGGICVTFNLSLSKDFEANWDLSHLPGSDLSDGQLKKLVVLPHEAESWSPDAQGMP